MKISLDWIKDYIDVTLSEEEIISGLTSLGLECTLHNENQFTFKGILIGKSPWNIIHDSLNGWFCS